MCVYLAPRWRRRSLLATLMLALTLLLTVDAARALRSSIETQQQTGSSAGSGSAAVNEVQVGDVDAGVVTTDTTQSSTTFTKKTWGAGSVSDDSKKSVSFSSLVQTTATAAPSGERSIEEPKSASGSMDYDVGTPSATTKAKGTTSAKQDDDDDSDESFDLELDDDRSDSGSDSENHDKTTGKTGTSNKSAPTPTPTPTATPTSASQQTIYPPQPTHPGSIDAKTLSWSEPPMYPQTTQPVSNVIATTTTPSTAGSSASGSASGQTVQGQSYQVSGSAKNAEAFEKSTRSAVSTTDSRSLDETLVVVIVGVVGAIGALLMFVSRKVLQETGDDKDLTDSSFF